jgi:hypothetical protein
MPPTRSNDRHLAADEIGRERGQPLSAMSPLHARISGHRLLYSGAAICLIISCSSAPTLSNNIIQKGLAFGRDWSGSVVLHRRLVGDDAVLDSEVLREFCDAGMSERLA